MMLTWLSITKNGRNDLKTIRIPKVIFYYYFVGPSTQDSYYCRSEMCIPLYSTSIVGFLGLILGPRLS